MCVFPKIPQAKKLDNYWANICLLVFVGEILGHKDIITEHQTEYKM